MSSYPVLWTRFHRVDRKRYAAIQFEVSLACAFATVYFGSGFAVALFLLAWAVNVLSKIPGLQCDVTETPKTTDFDRIFDLIRRLFWGAMFVVVVLTVGGTWAGLAVLFAQYAIFKWAPKKIRVLRGEIIIWDFG